MQVCAHHYFDELRDPAALLPDGRPLPVSLLFNFTPQEVRAAGELYFKLRPLSGRSPQLQERHVPVS
jgi:hypothetical protein